MKAVILVLSKEIFYFDATLHGLTSMKIINFSKNSRLKILNFVIIIVINITFNYKKGIFVFKNKNVSDHIEHFFNFVREKTYKKNAFYFFLIKKK